MWPRFAFISCLAASACGPLASTFEAEALPVAPVRECPAGWVSAEAGSACDAVLPAGDCPPGTMPVIGEEECQPVLTSPFPDGFRADPSGWGFSDLIPATPCEGATREAIGDETCRPVGDCAAPFPPADATLFVNGSFTAGELDATHFRSIGAAVAAAAAGAVVAIESGTYAETLTLSRSVSLVGRCAQKVILQGPAGSAVVGIEVDAGKSSLRGVTVKGHFAGTEVYAPAELALTEVVYDSNQFMGLWVSGRATVKDSVFRNGLLRGGLGGLGVQVDQGGHVELVSSAVSKNRQEGVVLWTRGSTAILDGVVIRDNQTAADGSGGSGLGVYDGAAAEVRRSVIAGNSAFGVNLDGALPGAANTCRLTLSDSVIRDTRRREVGRPDPSFPGALEYAGYNLQVTSNSTATVSNCALLRSGGSSLRAGVGATVDVTSSVIRGTAPDPADPVDTAGVEAFSAGQVRLAHSAIVDASEYGVLLADLSTRGELSDSVVADTRHPSPKPPAMGVRVDKEASLVLTRSAVLRTEGSAVYLGRAATGATSGLIDRSVLAGGRPIADGTTGRGLELWSGAVLELESSAVVDNRELALLASDVGTTVRVVGSVFRDTKCNGNGELGEGLHLQSGARLELVDSLVLRNHDVGLLVGLSGATAVVTGGAIAGTLPLERDGTAGMGAVSIDEGRLDLVGARVARNASIGVAVSAASATLSRTVVTANPVGIHVQDGSAITLADPVPATIGPREVVVTSDTTFEGNATRVGAGMVPLPKPFQK